jgi:hypothetical protein
MDGINLSHSINHYTGDSIRPIKNKLQRKSRKINDIVFHVREL